MLGKERGLSPEYLIEKIKAAIVIAVKKDYEVEDENVLVEIDPLNGRFTVNLVQDVVEEVENPHTQLSLEQAHAIRKTYQVGQRVVTPLKTKEFGRIAAQTAKHVIRQGIREAERSQLYSEMQSKAHEIVTAQVVRIDDEKGIVVLDMGKGEAVLPRSEQVPGEEFYEGQHVQVYVKDVLVTERGPRIIISRTSEQLVKRMFEMECPKFSTAPWRSAPSAARRGCAPRWPSGPRTRMWTRWAPASAPTAPASTRSWSSCTARRSTWCAGARTSPSSSARPLSPAKVLKVEILEGERKACRVTVPDHQLSLAIGNKGQNARLCARLTGYNIDIRPESGYYGEDTED